MNKNEKHSLTDLGWRYLWERANIVTLVVTSTGVIRRANAYASTFIGMEITGRSLADFVVDFNPAASPDRWWQPTEDLLLVNLRTASGLPQTVYATIWPLEDGLLWLGQVDGAEQERLREDFLSLNHELSQLSRAMELEKVEMEESRDQLRQLASRLILVREEERKSIARNIHDELGHNLTALKMNIAWLARKLPEHSELQEKFLGMRELADTTIQSIRRISTELRPDILDELGLPDAVEWQARKFKEAFGIECTIEIDPSIGKCSQMISLTMFRIFQESLTNVARHSKATNVKAALSIQKESLVLEVTDNGCGMKEDPMSNPESIGLIGMKERTLALGGEVVFSSASGSGSTIRATIPLR